MEAQILFFETTFALLIMPFYVAEKNEFALERDTAFSPLSKWRSTYKKRHLAYLPSNFDDGWHPLVFH